MELSALIEFDTMIERSREKAAEIFGERKQTYSQNWQARFIEVKS